MAKQVMPPARLDSRSTDTEVTDDLLMKVSLFAQLKRKPSIDKFPGTVRLRRYKKGDVICRQGDAGWTAFYILSTEDAYQMCQSQVQATQNKPDNAIWQTLLRSQAKHLAQLRMEPNNTALRRAATVYLVMARAAPAKQVNFLRRWLRPFYRPLLRRWFAAPTTGQDPRPQSIQIDAPIDIDYETMQAPLNEQVMFGEMSCRNGSPRSATIVADRDIFILEMLRNILDQLQRDAAFKAQFDETYKKRVLGGQRKLSIFADLSDAQFESIRDKLDFLIVEPGQILYDEFEKSDSLYVVQRGMLKVVKKASALLSLEHVRSWQKLAAALCEAESAAGTPKQRIWQGLSEAAKAACKGAAAAGAIADAGQRAILESLNDMIRDRKLNSAPEHSKVFKSVPFQEKLESFGLPAAQKEWSEQDWRRCNRLLLDDALNDLIRAHRRRVGPDCVLYLCSGGDFIGEMSVMGQPARNESCLAQGHPKDVGTSKDSGPTEVVRVPAAVLKELLPDAPALRSRLERKIAERRKRTQEQVRVPVYDDSRNVLLSAKFQQLGLIQGQKLMLIDLDRCTRCDECVRACVATHDDGRSRLFLDGPRFGKYLVPTSCRSCLDPVCMVGCPVGSIHRGDNGQMVIEDWCIGCGLCSQQCPYGSIQMHDIGIIAESAPGWRYVPLSAVGSGDWKRPRYRDRRWLEGRGPFVNDKVFQETLSRWIKKPEAGASMMNTMGSMMNTMGSLRSLNLMQMPAADEGLVNLEQPLCFRYSFRLANDQVGPEHQFKLTLTAKDTEVRVWVNGEALAPSEEKASGGKREYWMPPQPHARKATAKPAAAKAATKEVDQAEVKATLAAPDPEPVLPTNPLRAGWNVLAIQVSADCAQGAEFLSVRLDEVRKPTMVAGVAEEVTQKQVTERAVVCDLCSNQWGQRPACVNACPHDAAMRIDARSDFPTR